MDTKTIQQQIIAQYPNIDFFKEDGSPMIGGYYLNDSDCYIINKNGSEIHLDNNAFEQLTGVTWGAYRDFMLAQ